MCKKLIFLVFFALVLGLVSNAFSQVPDGQIRQTRVAPVIDGEIDSVWYGALAYALDELQTGNPATVTDDLDFSATWRALWDSTRLYILVDVNDDELVADSTGANPCANTYQDDSVEVYVDADNSKGTTYDGVNDFHYSFRWNSPGVVCTGPFSKPDTTGVEFSSAAKTNPTGYICEISMPWSTLGTTPELGDIIGLIVAVSDDDDGGARDVQFSGLVTVPNQMHQNPSVIPNMELIAAASRDVSSNPYPFNGATDVPPEVVLSWMPGEYAAQHDVCFGTSFDNVNDATTASAVYQGRQSETTYALDRLKFSQTYYWRIDEVNAPPDNTIFKGEVWQFTAEPVAYPIAGENIIATASSLNKANEGPENTINSSGLDADDLHSEESKTMWLSSTIGPQPTWIQYEFDRVHKLHEMLVWNHNSSLELVIGFGIKEATIEYSTDGTSWTTLGTTHEFARGSSDAGYAHNTTVDLSGVVAKYVKITANSNWGGFMPQFGLSEVRFLYIPVWPREPNPDSGATDTNVDNVTLSWRAGREAASHEVQLSDSNQAVIDGTALVATVSEASYDTGELQLNQNYYWKIVEVNEAETRTNWEGDVWDFTTRESLVVEDFEEYNNFSPDRVFQTWIDGVGYSADEFFPVENPGNGSGAAIGHDIWSYDSPHYDGDIMEKAIVHGSAQSAPLYYDNSAASFSEATANVANLSIGQDWTKHGIKALTLWFYGDPCNVAQQMYVKLNGSKMLYDGEAANITRIPWQPWNIELADFTGVDLSNVTELSIGLERIGFVGGTGVVYFDDISLYSYSRQLITPAEPSNVGLVAHYEFEGNANDSSGNGLHGTAVGDPIFVAGKVGQAISLDGIGDYVEITGYKGILGPNAITVTAWINTISTETGEIVGWGPNIAGQRFGFRINANRLRMEHQGGNIQGDTNVNDGEWHHVAVTVQENATISYPEVILYLNGKDDTRPGTSPNAFALAADQNVRIGSRPSNDATFFMGQIDDVRIYDYALSDAEVAWLAGRTQPFDKPF